MFYTYGAGQRENSLINTLYQGCRKNSHTHIGSCENYRDYIHVKEAVEGIIRISNVNESNIVNLGSGKAIKMKDFVNKFWKYLGGNPELLHFGNTPFYKNEKPEPNCFANLDKLKQLTGWIPTLLIEKGIKLTIKDLDTKFS